MQNKRLIRTKYFAGSDYVRGSASVTLEGAIQAAVMRLLRDSGVSVAYIHDERFGDIIEEPALAVRRTRNAVSLVWYTEGQFPRPDPRSERAREARKAHRAPAGRLLAPATAARH